MGCGESKEKQPPQNGGAPTPHSTMSNNNGPVVPPIAGADRRIIGGTAQSILDNSVQFRNMVETIQPLGVHRDAQHMMSDTREVGEYFRGRQVPHQIAGATDSSFFQMINTMKILCQTECTKTLTENLAKQGTYLDEAQSAKYGKQVAAEASKAISQMTEQYINSVFERNKSEGAANTNTTAAGAGGNAVGIPSHRGLSVAGGDASSRGLSAPRKSPRMSPSNNASAEPEAPVVLPAGRWIRAENSPFYWSDEERLFFHPESGQFFDPETNKWYDPDTDEWYDDDGEN